MSDPFASLLTSLKEDKKTKTGTTASPALNTPSVLTPAKKDAPQAAQINLTPLFPTKTISQNDAIHDDLDDLFGIPVATPQPSNTTPQTQHENKGESNDDFMSVFDNFDSNVQSAQQSINQPSVSPDPDSAAATEQTNTEEDVVDEVKDMEVARLMSLGMTIEKANQYYDKGVLYDDIIRKRREKQMREKQQESERAGTTFFNENNTNKKNISSSLFSVATDFLNRGKDLVDHLTAYPDEETNRLYKYGERENSPDHNKDERERFAPSINREALLDDDSNPFDINNYEQQLEHQFSNTSLVTSSSHENSAEHVVVAASTVVEEGDLLGGFDEGELQSKQSTIQASSKSPEKTSEPQPREASQPQVSSQHQSESASVLLDFDDQGTSNSGSATPFQSTLSAIPISNIELSGYKEFNIKAKELFTNGNYSAAHEEYEKSFNTLPAKHPLRILALSNMMIAELKIGEYSRCIENSKLALSMYPEDKVQWQSTIQSSDPHRTYKDIWPKIVARQAEAYEHQENFEMSLKSIELLLHNGYHDAKIMSAKRRCQKVLNPTEATPKPAKPATTIPKTSPAKVSPEPEKTYEAVEKIKEANKREEQIEKEKLVLYDIVFEKIANWKDNKDDDIRFLLSRLPSVVTWSDVKPVTTAELVIPKKVKIAYLRAIAKLHPDKLPADLSLENRMIAEDVFSVLSAALEKFKTENGMN